MKIQIRYFAVLREQAGVGAEELETVAPTARDLYAELVAAGRLSIDPALIKVAVNDRYTPMDEPLKDGSTVVFIPPVAGG